MARREYDKLVRDRIPEIIASEGRTPDWDAVDSETALKYLEKKLGEECTEYRESGEADELADVVEVVRGILYHRKMTWEELESIRIGKYEKRGGFEGGIRLKAVDGEQAWN